MSEEHYAEIERVLLYVSEARERAAKAHRDLTRDGAEAHLLRALETSEATLRAEHRRLLQSTFYGRRIGDDQERLAV
jgi:hypothetical protein